MTDIVQRLRLIDPNQVLLAPPPHDTSYLQAGLICHEAAAEIERLRLALTLAVQQNEVDPHQVVLMAPPLDTAYLQVGLIYRELANEIERLRAERKEDQGVIARWRGRTLRAEAEIERLREAALAEREACAKRCERVADDYIAANGRHAAAIAYECAVAIRATGEKP